MSAILTQITGFFGMFSSDALYLISIFIILYACSMYFGRGRIVSMIVSFFPAMLLFNSFPFIDKLIFFEAGGLLALNKLAIFLIFFIPISIIVSRFIFSSSEYSDYPILKNGVLAFSALIVVLVFSYSVVSLDALHNFSPQIDALFSGEGKTFYWNLLSLALLAVI